MSIKSDLLELKRKINKSKNKKVTKEEYIEYSKEYDKLSKPVTRKEIDLNKKIDEFITWYYENMVKGKYTEIGEYREPIELRNFIDKMAIWYELRYPDYEIGRLMPGFGQERLNINETMFKNNNYVNNLLDEDSDIKDLDWDEFYNAHSFIKSLPWREKWLLTKPRYNYIVHIDSNIGAELQLTKNGIVAKSRKVYELTNREINDFELIGMRIEKVLELFNSRRIKLPINNEIEKVIKDADNQRYQKDEMLNCVMYRIIERGGNRIGPRRALLFAKEFKRNIDIPMQYSIDRSDPGLRKFMNQYLKSGGSKDLKCYVDYFSHYKEDDKIETVSIQDLILTLSNDAATFYTPEEDELHQRLVNVLASRTNQKEIKEIEVNKERIKRKLEKSKTNNN